jgi:hypothetical protein
MTKNSEIIINMYYFFRIVAVLIADKAETVVINRFFAQKYSSENL